MPAFKYHIEPAEYRTWYGVKRYDWRVVHVNKNLSLRTGQGYSRRIDRNEAALNFYDACDKTKVGFAGVDVWEA